MFRKRVPPAMPARAIGDAPPVPGAFLLCPIACLPVVTQGCRLQQQALYEWAYRQAQDVVRPSILERDLLGVWN
jgi:hypothetical protein